MHQGVGIIRAEDLHVSLGCVREISTQNRGGRSGYQRVEGGSVDEVEFRLLPSTNVYFRQILERFPALYKRVSFGRLHIGAVLHTGLQTCLPELVVAMHWRRSSSRLSISGISRSQRCRLHQAPKRLVALLIWELEETCVSVVRNHAFIVDLHATETTGKGIASGLRALRRRGRRGISLRAPGHEP